MREGIASQLHWCALSLYNSIVSCGSFPTLSMSCNSYAIIHSNYDKLKLKTVLSESNSARTNIKQCVPHSAIYTHILPTAKVERAALQGREKEWSPNFSVEMHNLSGKAGSCLLNSDSQTMARRDVLWRLSFT